MVVVVGGVVWGELRGLRRGLEMIRIQDESERVHILMMHG